MSLLLCTQIILFITCIIFLLSSIATYLKIRQALQWWSFRQSIKLFLEAEKIRDGLLQESFTIRRSLDMLTGDNLDLSVSRIQACLKKIHNLHQSLVQLSDRLFPQHIQDSLPLAIECLLAARLTSNSHLSFHLDMPVNWRRESVERSWIILSALEELLTIAVPEALIPVSIYISLKQRGNTGQLMVQITYSDVVTFMLNNNLREIKYLCESCRLLTSGKSFYRRKNLTIAWYYCWSV